MIGLARNSRLALAFVLVFGTASLLAPQQVTAQEGGDEQPVVAFMQDGNVWLMSSDGSEQQPITDDAEAAYSSDGIHYPWYEWSPDGQYLLIVREERQMNAGPPTRELLIYQATTGEMTSLIDDLGPGAFFPSWALDDNQIAYVSADPLSGTGDLYALSAIDLNGESRPIADIPGPSCNLPSGQPFDPAFDLFAQEFGPFSGMILDRTIFWREDQRDLWFDTRCSTAVYVDLTTGEQTDTGLDQIVIGPGGLVAGMTGPASHGADVVIATEPTGGNQRPLRTGGTPSWAMGSGDLFFVSINFGTEYMNLMPEEEDLSPFSLTFNRSALWIAPADGSDPVKLVDRAAYAFGTPSPAADGSFVVFTRIDNSSELWDNRTNIDTYSQEMLDEFGPEARIQIYDRDSGELSTLVSNGFRPMVQPLGVNIESDSDGDTPVSG